MKEFDLIYLELGRFIDSINIKKQWNIEHTIIPDLDYKKQLRCMSRIWDSKDWDINKQCKNSVFLDELCKSCYKRNTSSKIGRVNEYPDEESVIDWYIKGLRKHNPLLKNIYSEINLNNYKKFVTKKSIKHNINNKEQMESSKIEINSKKIKFKIKTKLNKDEYNNYDLDKDLYISKDINELQEWWEDFNTEKIKIFDNINNSYGIFATDIVDNKNYLLNKKKIIIGEFYDWESDLVDTSYKNSNNVVFDPITNLPINEYLIYEKTAIYHNVAPGKYRIYRYDELNRELINTSSVEALFN